MHAITSQGTHLEAEEHLVGIRKARLPRALEHEAANDVMRHHRLNKTLADDLQQPFVVDVSQLRHNVALCRD